MIFKEIYKVNSTTPHSQAITLFSSQMLLLSSLSAAAKATITEAILQCCFISTYPLGHTGEYFTFNQGALPLSSLQPCSSSSGMRHRTDCPHHLWRPQEPTRGPRARPNDGPANLWGIYCELPNLQKMVSRNLIWEINRNRTETRQPAKLQMKKTWLWGCSSVWGTQN